MGQQKQQNKQVNNPRKDAATSSKPDVRNNLDSRKNEEQELKGKGQVTHNQKQTKKD